jgi:DNA-binding GntR family transcriptional regulator
LPTEADFVAATGFTRYEIHAALTVLERNDEVVHRPGRRRFVPGESAPPTTLYEQVANAIRDDIRCGRLAVAARIPTEMALVKRFGVSRVTVVRALLELERAGVLARDRNNRRVVA